MEVMPAEPFRLQQSIGFRCAIYGGQSKNPAEWPGRDPETRNHSGRGDAAEGPAIPIRSRALSSVRERVLI